MILRILLVLGFALFLSATCSAVFAGPLDETRYCGEPRRDASGDLYRSSAVRTAFLRAHPCPVTGSSTGPCDGWQVDHVIPLACGGCDAVSNLQWLPVGIKTAAFIGKDRFERRIYGGVIDSSACTAPPLVP